MITKVITIVLEVEDGKKIVSRYGDMQLNEAYIILHELILREAQNLAVESYKKEVSNGSNMS